MERIFHTPEGVRDIYNGECSQKRKVQERIHRVFHQYGYEDIETPLNILKFSAGRWELFHPESCINFLTGRAIPWC